MRPPADWAKRIAPALALLGLHATAAHGSRSGIETTLGAPPLASEVCESRTINYITHSLPQQCLRTSWNAPTPTASDNVIVEATAVPTSATTLSGSPEPTQHNATQPAPQDSPEELAASSFMSFEEWKEMMLRKSGQDPANIKTHKQREHHAERDPALNHGDVDTFGEEGEISLDFDALTEKVSEMASAASGGAAPPERQDVKEEQILYDDGKTQYYRSKDAGKTCKERFSYSSFDAGATVLKTSSGAKNAKAILVENKDSYMLLECRTKNKFVIVELSDDILVDTVVLANFEFFSSMIRKFRVSASDRYPVKMDKWVDLGTFEARNSRDIQAFLIEHPQIYTKYIRVEFLSHWGNEFYCPVSLLRVHGTRMLDTWKEPSHDDEPEQLEGAAREPAADTQSVPEAPPSNDFATAAKEESTPEVVTEVGLTPWQPIFQGNISLGICAMRSPTTAEPTPVTSGSSNPHNKAAGDADTAAERPSAATGIGGASQSSNSSSPAAASPQSPAAQGQATSSAPSTVPSVPPRTGNDSTASGQGQKQSDVRADAADTTPVPTTVTASRNKTSAVSSSPSASPTIQESFFKTVTKRLQLLESNTSLSLQYIEEQSRFLQDVLLKMERKQISRVDAFLDSLNKTVLSELRTVRTQYDQIWQSTVIALETQREQSQRDIAALSSRLNVLADEVVFQKRMAILQSVLLLSCLVLVIFSRGGLAALDSASFPAFPANHHNNHTTPPPSVYRRYGYDYDYTAGPGGLDMSASPPTRAAAEGRGRERPDYPSPSTPVTTKRSTSTLATSALPRHLYAAATTTTSSSSSSASVLRDKTLPLTPPSDVSFSRESTPTMRLDRSSSSSSSSSNHNNNIDGGSGPDGDAEVSSIEANPNPNPAAECARVSRPIREQGGAEEQDEQKEDEGEREKPPLARARSTVSHLGGLRKPLPALPEDPS